METFGMRRSQSLRGLSGVQERSWVMPAPTRWDRKSVPELVQHYQSCADLMGLDKQEHQLQGSDSRRQQRDGDNVALRGSGRGSNLSRCRSMDVLPSGTKALCALFESKASLQRGFSSSPRLNPASAPARSTAGGRGHTETTIQRAAQVEGRRAMNGPPGSSARAPGYPRDDKNSPSLTKGGGPTGPSRDQLSTSSSVRDRSASYLSRATAIGSPRGSEQPEFVGTPRTRPKNSKFDSPAKDMCSACLTPVYPMEKMLANKRILHINCFCCKHCKKKLSIYNCSSLYGEFYCTSHYQQLFKRTGNYDEGFGYKQHKDRWVQKNNVTEEPNASSKMTKGTPDRSGESSDGVFVKKNSARAMVYNSGADVTGKLKMRWPPEKKSPGFNSAQQTEVRKRLSGIGGALTAEQHKSDNNQLKIHHGGGMSSFISGVNEQSKKTSSEKWPSKLTKLSSDPAKDSVSSTGRNFSLPPVSDPVTNWRYGETNMALTSKPNYQASNRLHANGEKVKKSVRFAPDVDVAHDLSRVNESKDTEDGSDENNLHQISFKLSRKQLVADVENNQEVPQTDLTVLNGPEDKVEESLGSQSFTDIFNSTQEDVKHQKPAEVAYLIPGNSVNRCESGGPSTLSPEEDMHGEEAGFKRNKEQFEKTESAKDNENGSDPKKPIVRTNAKQAEKTKVQLGSWSKAKTPLSEIFPSGGNDKANRVEPRHVKPGGGLLGRLFQTFSEKPQEATKLAAQDEVNYNKTLDHDKKTEEVEEAVTKEIQKEGNLSQAPLQEQEAEEHLKGRPSFPETNTMDNNTIGSLGKSTEPSNLHETSTSETGDDGSATEQSDDPESDLQSSESTDLSVTDPTKAESEDLTKTLQSASQASEESTNQLIAEILPDDIMSSTWINDDCLGNGASSACDDPLAFQINAEESSHNPNEQLDASHEGGRDVFGEAFLDLNCRVPQDSSYLISPSGTSVSSLIGAALPEATSSDPFSQLDTHIISKEPHQGGAFASSNQASNFLDDIFGVTDVFTVLPSSPATNSTDDSVGPDTSSTAAPSAWTGPCADDIFAPEPQLLPVSPPTDANVFLDSLLVSGNNSMEQIPESTGSSWMDDLIG
uniref:Xin actin binding repeat containing 1 n=1 Tax=Gasterosteus aculeatus aculeatus TaxID=481459 RepID=A0AAQ4R0L5_GASAC